MDRSIAARSPAGRLGRSRRSARPSKRARSTGAIGAASRHAGGLLRAIRARRRLRIALICLLVALPLLGGSWLWLRHSSLVAVQHVRVSGVHGPQSHAIERALIEAAKGMSTLDPKPAALRAAVARFPLVSSIRAIPGFPHGMRIVVVEQPPVAALLAGGSRTAVAATGVVLGPALLSAQLPEIAEATLPASGDRIRNSLVRDALTVLGAAPPAVDKLAKSVYFGPRGLTVAMRNGLLIYFGDTTRPQAKWLSLARVLADSSSAGALYVDVRLPGRPAAGFAPGTAPSHSESTQSETPVGKPESTVAALAAKLAAATPEGKRKLAEEREAQERSVEAPKEGSEEASKSGAATGGGEEASSEEAAASSGGGTSSTGH
jgi:cell division protein FtsQ